MVIAWAGGRSRRGHDCTSARRQFAPPWRRSVLCSRLVVERRGAEVDARTHFRGRIIGPPPSIGPDLCRDADHAACQPEREVGRASKALRRPPVASACADLPLTTKLKCRCRSRSSGRSSGSAEAHKSARRACRGRRGRSAPPTPASRLLVAVMTINSQAGLAARFDAFSAASMTAIPPFMSATPGPPRMPSSIQWSVWNG